MKTENKISIKRTYHIPEVTCILLDNAISLQLESPGAPNSGDEVYNTPNNINNQPFKSDIA